MLIKWTVKIHDKDIECRLSCVNEAFGYDTSKMFNDKCHLLLQTVEGDIQCSDTTFEINLIKFTFEQ